MKPRWHEWPAILGGRFDPIHVGHIEAARGVFEHPGVRELWVMPTPRPAYKNTIATPRERVAMARTAFAGLSLPIRVDERELARYERTGQPTFSYDTLQELSSDSPNWTFVLGTDQFAALPTWHRFPEVLDLCHWIVLERKGEDLTSFTRTISEMQRSQLIQTVEPSLWKTSAGRFVGLFPTHARACSSTQVRSEITRTGEPPIELVPDAVRAYLKASGLYGTRKDRP